MLLGLIASVSTLVVTATVWLWPFIATTKFWMGAGMVAGIIGTFIFGIGLAQYETDKS